MRVPDPHEQQRLDLPEFMTMALNMRSRDEMVKFIAGLREVYRDAAARTEILSAIERDVMEGRSMSRGRPGLSFWAIFVLLAARTVLQADYDRLEDLAENHKLIRHACGFGDWQSDTHLEWDRIWVNVKRVSPETLELINRRVVQVGHQDSPKACVMARADSFVMQTNIHAPGDVRQIADGLRCVLRHATQLAEVIGSTLLRQHAHLEKQAKILTLRASQSLGSRGRGRDARVQATARALCDFAHDRMTQALELVAQYQATTATLGEPAAAQAYEEYSLLMFFLTGLCTVTDHARTRLVNDGEVALSDKLFSLFEPHTECIHRGKARAAVEFGHRCIVVEDTLGFIIHAEVMNNGQQDRDIVVPLADALAKRFPAMRGLSLDRGYHSPENQEKLKQILPDSCLPTTGISAAAQQYNTASEQWKATRRNHPGIESAIKRLELDYGCAICPNKGRTGYHRHLQQAVLAANLTTLGRRSIAKTAPTSRAAYSQRRPAA